MRPEDESFLMGLVWAPTRPPTITGEDVLRHFGYEDGSSLVRDILSRAVEQESGSDLEWALILAETFGRVGEHEDLLASLVYATWHQQHENLVDLLDSVRSTKAIDAFVHASTWIPDYLRWDESRALARKAVWAIGKLPGVEGKAALERLASSPDALVRERAQRQIDRRRLEPADPGLE